MATQDVIHAGDSAKVSLINDPKARSLFFQALVVLLLVAGVWWIVDNTIQNLRNSGITTGWAFLRGRAGFDISDRLIDYTSDSTFSRALVVGALNTLKVAATGIVLATVLGFLVGVGRLSNNWLVRKICMVYVEIFRDIPPLLVILFWYQGVLAVLPQVRESISLPFNSFLNVRGFYTPAVVWNGSGMMVLGGLALGVLLSWYVARRAYARQMATGQRFPVLWTSVALIIGMPLLAYVLSGMPATMDLPQKGGFNLTGGANIKPEFLSLLLALSFYTASFIAEIVRAGILGVSHGQTEAYSALGIRSNVGLRKVVIPQALRIIIPPLTSQYLNLTKNSTLGVAIGYPELYSTGGTILNQTGQAIEVVVIFMIFYLSISLLTSGFMNWFNNKMALKER